MSTSRAATATSSAVLESGRNAGGGCEPMTLSTAIFSGSGTSSATGTARRVSASSPAMCGQYARASRDAAADLQVPAVVGAAAARDRAAVAERALERGQPGLGRAPVLAPDCSLARAGEAHARGAAPAPDGEAEAEAAGEARGGLQEVQEQCERTDARALAAGP